MDFIDLNWDSNIGRFSWQMVLLLGFRYTCLFEMLRWEKKESGGESMWVFLPFINGVFSISYWVVNIILIIKLGLWICIIYGIIDFVFSLISSIITSFGEIVFGVSTLRFLSLICYPILTFAIISSAFKTLA
jgi:hypothetical protein